MLATVINRGMTKKKCFISNISKQNPYHELKAVENNYSRKQQKVVKQKNLPKNTWNLDERVGFVTFRNHFYIFVETSKYHEYSLNLPCRYVTAKVYYIL